MICYTLVIMVSSNKEPSTTNGRSYSLVSVAAAMYLMTSIAAADLGAGIALISEARIDMAAKRWVQRKMFGFMLLASFVLLATASIRVLFKTSLEDVDLVVGAATVLFIADVDEKVMVVLKVIPCKWRLFWVLELIGLSAGVALLGLRVTGNASNVSGNDNVGCTHRDAYGVRRGCFIHSWYFIFLHLVPVTLISLLVNTIVARPKEFVKKHVLGNGSWQDWLFTLVLASLILVSFYFYFDHSWVFEQNLSIVSIYVICGVYRLFFVCKRRVCCRGPNQSIAGYMNFRWTSSTRFGVIYVPIGLFLSRIVWDTLAITIDLAWSFIDFLDPSNDWYFVPDALYIVLFDMWLVWCICREDPGSPERPSSPGAANMVVSESVMIAESEGCGLVTESPEEGVSHRLRNLLLGWIQYHALFDFDYLFRKLIYLYIEYDRNCVFFALSALYWFAWTLVGVCAAASNTKGVAFWSVAMYMLGTVVIFILEWIESDGVVKLANF